MSGLTAVLLRELLSFWVTPLAWILLAVFLGLQGFSFFLMVDHYGKFADASAFGGPIQGYFASFFVPVSLLIICPALSMRTFAEEKRSGTLEPLLTAPVSIVSVVVGKYLALLLTYFGLWSPTVLYAFILRDTGVVDWPVVASSYLGIAMIGAAYLAIGTLMSALTSSQLVAMLLTTLALFGMFILGIGERVFDEGPLLSVCQHVSVLSQLEDFSKGVIDARRLVFDVSLALLALFFTARIIEGWREPELDLTANGPGLRHALHRLMAGAGLFAAAVCALSVNVLVSRFYQRWDATSTGVYSLSAETVSALERLEQPLSVVVFLSQHDPLTSSVRYMLEAYRAHSSLLKVRFIDPDRNPAEFVALQNEYGMFDARTQNGRLASDASVVLSLGERHWFVTTDDILTYDEAQGQSRPQLEHALTEGIINILQAENVSVCFTQGHGELVLDAGGPEGLSELRRYLEQNNYSVRSVDLNSSDQKDSLNGCALTVVAGLERSLVEAGARRLLRHAQAGGSLLLATGPVVAEDGLVGPTGLESIVAGVGLEFERDLVFETEPALKMPIGFAGEVFLATPKGHDVTRGFVHDGEVAYRVLVQMAQGLKLVPTAKAQALLVTSDESVAIDDLAVLARLTPDELVQRAAASAGQRVVGAIAEHRFGDDGGKAARVVVLGSVSPLGASSWREPALLGTRRFIENCMTWLAERPTLVTLPQKPAQPAGLSLSEESLLEVQRYVTLYMPLCAALIGVLVLMRRRHEVSPRSTV